MEVYGSVRIRNRNELRKLYLRKIYTDLGLHNIFFSKPSTIRNDNMACVQCCKNSTTRTIRHIQLQDNAVRESIQNKRVHIDHIPGSSNIADIFTKKDRDKSHFVTLLDKILFPPIKCNHTLYFPTTFIYEDFNSVQLTLTGYGGC